MHFIELLVKVVVLLKSVTNEEFVQGEPLYALI